MKFNYKVLGFSAILLLVVDSFYLTLIGKSLFDKVVKNIQGTSIQMNLLGALLSYVCLIILLNYFILQKNGGLFDAFLLGFCVYGVFDATNLAIFKNYDFTTGLIDTLWGGILFTLVTYITRFIIRY